MPQPESQPESSGVIHQAEGLLQGRHAAQGGEATATRAADRVVDYEREFKRDDGTSVGGVAVIAAALIGAVALPVESLGWERFLLWMVPFCFLGALLGVWDGSRD